MNLVLSMWCSSPCVTLEMVVRLGVQLNRVIQQKNLGRAAGRSPPRPPSRKGGVRRPGSANELRPYAAACGKLADASKRVA
jgi:hypothetical protein